MLDLVLVLIFFIILLPKWIGEAGEKNEAKKKLRDNLNEICRWELTVTNFEIEMWADDISKDTRKFMMYRDEVVNSLKRLPYTEEEILGSTRVPGRDFARKIILMGNRGYIPRYYAINGMAEDAFSINISKKTERARMIESYKTILWLTDMINSTHHLSVSVYISRDRRSCEPLTKDNAVCSGTRYWSPTLGYWNITN